MKEYRFSVPREWRETIVLPEDVLKNSGSGLSASDLPGYYDALTSGLLKRFDCRAMGGNLVSLFGGTLTDEVDVFFENHDDVAEARAYLESRGYSAAHDGGRAILMKKTPGIPTIEHIHLVDSCSFNSGGFVGFDRFDLFASKVSVSADSATAARGCVENLRTRTLSVDVERFLHGDRAASWTATMNRIAKYLSWKGFDKLDGTFFGMLDVVGESLAGDTFDGLVRQCALNFRRYRSETKREDESFLRMCAAEEKFETQIVRECQRVLEQFNDFRMEERERNRLGSMEGETYSSKRKGFAVGVNKILSFVSAIEGISRTEGTLKGVSRYGVDDENRPFYIYTDMKDWKTSEEISGEPDVCLSTHKNAEPEPPDKESFEALEAICTERAEKTAGNDETNNTADEENIEYNMNHRLLSPEESFKSRIKGNLLKRMVILAEFVEQYIVESCERFVLPSATATIAKAIVLGNVVFPLEHLEKKTYSWLFDRTVNDLGKMVKIFSEGEKDEHDVFDGEYEDAKHGRDLEKRELVFVFKYEDGIESHITVHLNAGNPLQWTFGFDPAVNENFDSVPYISSALRSLNRVAGGALDVWMHERLMETDRRFRDTGKGTSGLSTKKMAEIFEHDMFKAASSIHLGYNSTLDYRYCNSEPRPEKETLRKIASFVLKRKSSWIEAFPNNDGEKMSPAEEKRRILIDFFSENDEEAYSEFSADKFKGVLLEKMKQYRIPSIESFSETEKALGVLREISANLKLDIFKGHKKEEHENCMDYIKELTKSSAFVERCPEIFAHHLRMFLSECAPHREFMILKKGVLQPYENFQWSQFASWHFMDIFSLVSPSPFSEVLNLLTEKAVEKMLFARDNFISHVGRPSVFHYLLAFSCVFSRIVDDNIESKMPDIAKNLVAAAKVGRLNIKNAESKANVLLSDYLLFLHEKQFRATFGSEFYVRVLGGTFVDIFNPLVLFSMDDMNMYFRKIRFPYVPERRDFFLGALALNLERLPAEKLAFDMRWFEYLDESGFFDGMVSHSMEETLRDGINQNRIDRKGREKLCFKTSLMETVLDVLSNRLGDIDADTVAKFVSGVSSFVERIENKEAEETAKDEDILFLKFQKREAKELAAKILAFASLCGDSGFGEGDEEDFPVL